jgi:hypothetical protein
LAESFFQEQRTGTAVNARRFENARKNRCLRDDSSASRAEMIWIHNVKEQRILAASELDREPFVMAPTHTFAPSSGKKFPERIAGTPSKKFPLCAVCNSIAYTCEKQTGSLSATGLQSKLGGSSPLGQANISHRPRLEH